MGFQRAQWHSGLTYQQTCPTCKTVLQYTDYSLDFRPWYADGYVDCPKCKSHLRHNENYALGSGAQPKTVQTPAPDPAPDPAPAPASAPAGETPAYAVNLADQEAAPAAPAAPAAKAAFCTQCGHAFGQSDLFCAQCGNKRG